MGTEDDFADQVAGVAALADPIRRDLYLYVAAQRDAVSRDRASEAVGVPRHTAKFHLDKLVEQGLLDIDFRRLTGRRGPGAGRPAKLYRRSSREVSITLPERRYDLAGQLLATAVDASTRSGTPVLEALHAAATELGGAVGSRARDAMGPDPTRERAVRTACATLTEYGYEPRGDGPRITLANCPFDALAKEHVELVCGMNLTLIDAVARQVDARLTARLDPAADRCCVVLDAD